MNFSLPSTGGDGSGDGESEVAAAEFTGPPLSIFVDEDKIAGAGAGAGAKASLISSTKTAYSGGLGSTRGRVVGAGAIAVILLRFWSLEPCNVDELSTVEGNVLAFL
jgi:hypothetical protein